MKEIDYGTLFDYIDSTYKKLCDIHGESDYQKYLELTDKKYLNSIFGNNVIKYDSTNYVFVQLALHAQNVGSSLPNMLKFDKNFDKLYETLHGFDPSKVVNSYKKKEDLASKLEQFITINNREIYTGKTILRYSDCLLECANYLSRFNNRRDIIDDLKRNYVNGDVRTLVNYFFNKITKKQFGVALVCDFLKEVDEAFSDIPKPDRYIMRFVGKLIYQNEDYYYGNDKDKYDCIEKFREIVNRINTAKPNLKLNAYKLDRMVYLICSDKFFLDLDSETINSKFLSNISLI